VTTERVFDGTQDGSNDGPCLENGVVPVPSVPEPGQVP
jgi:hypothetical protein